jgi:hypothetical protein
MVPRASHPGEQYVPEVVPGVSQIVKANRKPALDIVGRRFNRLVVTARAGIDDHERAMWRCVCDCGTERIVGGFRLRSGHTKSCGCLRDDKVRARVTTHGKSRTKTHNSWVGMLQRCRYPKHSQFARYGGRGILLCDRWLKFENFLADMGERPVGTSLDRIDSNGNYEPGNCRWATGVEQASNRSSNVYIERNGVSKTIKQWCDELGIKPDVIYGRLRWGKPKDKVFDGLN